MSPHSDTKEYQSQYDTSKYFNNNNYFLHSGNENNLCRNDRIYDNK